MEERKSKNEEFKELSKKELLDVLSKNQKSLLKNQKTYKLYNFAINSLSVGSVAGIGLFAFASNPVLKLCGLGFSIASSCLSMALKYSKSYLKSMHEIEIATKRNIEFEEFVARFEDENKENDLEG